MPISYTGREFDEGKKITWRRLRGLVDAGQVPLWRLTRRSLGDRGPTGRAVVVNFEAGPLLAAACGRCSPTRSAGPVELVVVDNGSRDGSIDALLAAHPDVRVVRAPGNVGYARAANLGTAATKAPIVAVLNPDTVVEPGAAARSCSTARARAAARRVRAAAAQPRRLRLSVGPDVAVDPGRDRSRPARTVVAEEPVHGPVPPARRRPGAPRLVDWVSGAAIWLRRGALDEVGGWDERYFMYLEDTDLCWRLRRAGWEVAYEPAGVVVHVQGASASRRPYRMLLEHHRSAWRFARVRFTGPRARCCRWPRSTSCVRGHGDGRARVATSIVRGHEPTALLASLAAVSMTSMP